MLCDVVFEFVCYYCWVMWFLIVFVLMSDVVMVLFGGMFKWCESIIGWLGDIFL